MYDKSQHSAYHFKSLLACGNITVGLPSEEMNPFPLHEELSRSRHHHVNLRARSFLH